METTEQKMTWDELAAHCGRLEESLKGSEEARSACELKLAGRQKILDEINTGLAGLFPDEGWGEWEHPEIGDMTEEFAENVVERVRRMKQANYKLHEQVSEIMKQADENRKAAGVAIALATGRLQRLKDLLQPETFAVRWHEAASAYYEKTCGVRIPSWNSMPKNAPAKLEALTISKHLLSKVDEEARLEDILTNKIAEEIIEEGEELATALAKIAVVQRILRQFWDEGFIKMIRELAANGIEFLPPGVIVHNTKRFSGPHRPE